MSPESVQRTRVFPFAIEAWLKELLAVIHRDGGYYTEHHGLMKSVSDAITVSHRRIDRSDHEEETLP